MSIALSLAAFQASVSQCDSLVANAHKTDATGVALFPALDQRQITVAAFLNLFMSWETFLEEVLSKLLAGSPTILGRTPVRYVVPPTEEVARLIIIGVNRFFDYGNHDNVRRIVGIYFENGYPFEPHLSAVNADLCDLRTMRNASAHISSTTQAALESLAQRITSTPQPRIDLYSLLTSNDPRSNVGNTVFAEFRDKLLIVAELIANG
jgi:hypothetical protein